MANIKFKIKGNNRLLYMEYGTEKKFRSVCFDTEVEDKDVNGKIVRQVFVNLTYMKNVGTDPTKQRGMIDTQDYNLLGKPENIGVEFTIKGLTRENIEDDVLILTRNDYYIIEVHKETTPELNDDWREEIAKIEVLTPKDGNSDFNELNEIIRNFSEKGVKNIHIWKLKNLVWGQCWSDKPLGELQSKVNDVLKTATGTEIDWISNIEDKRLYEVDSYKKRISEHPGENTWTNYALGTKYYEHVASRKNAAKDFSKKLVDAINAAKRMIPEVEKIINDWRNDGGLTDTEYNAKVKEFNQEKPDIQARFDKLKQEITNGKHKKFDTEFNQKINKAMDGISASGDLGTPTEIASDEINLFTATNKQTKLDKKNELKKLLKILNKKREVVEEFEDKIKGGEGEKYNCIQCGKEKDKTANPPIDGKYCSDKCKNEANKGSDEYTCAKCNNKFTDTPTIKEGKNYCVNCKDTVGNDNKDKGNDEEKDISKVKTEAIQAINAELKKTPEVKVNELDSDCRNWENQIKGFSEEKDIIFVREQVLSNIKRIRAEKEVAAKMDKEAEDIENKKGPALKESLKNLEGDSEKEHFKNLKAKVEQQEDRYFQEDPDGFKDLMKEIVESKMINCKVSESELGAEEKNLYTKLKNKEIGDKDQIKQAKQKLVDFIGNKEVDKEIEKIKKEVKAVSKSDKQQKKLVKDKLLALLGKDNIYFKARKSEINKLIKELEISSSSQTTTKNPSPIPWKIILPVVAVVVIAGVGLVWIIRKRKIQRQTREEKSL